MTARVKIKDIKSYHQLVVLNDNIKDKKRWFKGQIIDLQKKYNVYKTDNDNYKCEEGLKLKDFILDFKNVLMEMTRELRQTDEVWDVIGEEEVITDYTDYIELLKAKERFSIRQYDWNVIIDKTDSVVLNYYLEELYKTEY